MLMFKTFFMKNEPSFIICRKKYDFFSEFSQLLIL